MSPVAAPSDKRFRRAHVKPGRRRRWRSILRPLLKYGLVTAVTLLGIYEAGSVVAHARVLQIDHIAVRGNTHFTASEVEALLGGIRGQNILWTDLKTWRLKLLGSPWVKDAAFRRVLPSTVEVLIEERRPVALGRISNQLYLIDEQGVTIDEFGPAYSLFDLPIVDGLSGAKADSSDTDARRAQLAARVITALRPAPEIIERLSQIDVRDPENAGVILKGDSAVIYVGADRFLVRLQSYLQLADRLRESMPSIDSVDLRFDSQIVARPSGRSTQVVVPIGTNRPAASRAAGKQ